MPSIDVSQVVTHCAIDRCVTSSDTLPLAIVELSYAGYNRSKTGHKKTGHNPLADHNRTDGNWSAGMRADEGSVVTSHGHGFSKFGKKTGPDLTFKH